MPLVDPSVARLADGVERANTNLRAAETYLPILYPSSHAANLLERSSHLVDFQTNASSVDRPRLR